VADVCYWARRDRFLITTLAQRTAQQNVGVSFRGEAEADRAAESAASVENGHAADMK
jgi:hypothetical protein